MLIIEENAAGKFLKEKLSLKKKGFHCLKRGKNSFTSRVTLKLSPERVDMRKE